MRQVYEILKVRWPEAVMLIGLYTGASVLYQHLAGQFEPTSGGDGPQMPWGPSFLLGLGSMILFIVLQMQIWGFLRTAALQPTEPRSPMELLRTGSPFFWRLLGFQVLFFLALLFVASVVITLLGILIFRQHAVRDLPVWLHSLSFFLSFLLLLKPFVLMPAMVLVYEYRLSEAFFAMQGLSFFRMPRALVVTAVGFACLSAGSILIDAHFPPGLAAQLFRGVEGFLTGLLLTGAYLLAVLCFAPRPSGTADGGENMPM